MIITANRSVRPLRRSRTSGTSRWPHSTRIADIRSAQNVERDSGPRQYGRRQESGSEEARPKTGVGARVGQSHEETAEFGKRPLRSQRALPSMDTTSHGAKAG